MSFEEDFLRNRRLKEQDEIRREENNRKVIQGFELSKEEIANIDGMLTKAKKQEKISLEQYGNIMSVLKSAIYKTRDSKVTDFWFETINSFKDHDMATAILTNIDKYRHKGSVAA